VSGTPTTDEPPQPTGPYDGSTLPYAARADIPAGTPPSAPDLQTGARPVPEYELVQFLGEGSFGQVWKARDEGGIEVALKFVRLDTHTSAAELRAFEVVKNERHPHVLPLFRSWRRGNWLVLALELGEQNLYQRLREVERAGHLGIAKPELLEYLRDAGAGLDYLHGRKIQHRDVKPENLLLVGGRVKVADFGLAKLLEAAIATNTNRGMAGTPAFAAPEVWGGKTSKHSDQFALAVSWCQLRGGRLPFPGGDWRAIARAVCDGTADLSMIPEVERPAVARALEKGPDRRWPSCREFVEALHASGNAGAIPTIRRAPEPLDCTGTTGVSPADVRRAQEAWARYLGRNVEETVEIGDDATMTFVLVPPGKFRMGSPEDEKDRDADAETLHPVVLAGPFDLGKYPVTQAQYRALATRLPGERPTDPNPSRFKGADRPVERVSWDEADAFARELTKLLSDQCAYRLPTEAEWEYACRGGRPPSQAYGVGDGRSLTYREANLDDKNFFCLSDPERYRGQTTAVGAYDPNALGLFDLHGNVWEWCADLYGLYPRRKATNPTGTAAGRYRVLRGGGWISQAWSCRAASRGESEPGVRLDSFGFRLARGIQVGVK
jgi:formylglycine-generating enzyme required for sulfatase activity